MYITSLHLKNSGIQWKQVNKPKNIWNLAMDTQAKVSPVDRFNKKKPENQNFSELLYLYADVLFYPENDFFKLLNELGFIELVRENKNLEEIQNQYISLFEANLKGVDCVPFASYWFNKRLLGKEAIKLKHFYEKCGFKFNERDFKMPWDHIAVELSFLANLIENKDYKAAVEMIKEHMGWIEKFKECLKTKSKVYYTIVKGAHDYLNRFIEEG